MQYRWIVNKEHDDHTVKQIAEAENIPDSIARILVSRGTLTTETAHSFFYPSMEDLHDPFLMDGVREAVERIERAQESGELIWIYGDYDVDGTTSTALLLHYLREFGCNVDYFITDRFSEGYGLTRSGLLEAADAGAGLIISVDMGTTSVDATRYAGEIGLDVIICDHHEPSDELPDVYALLNPIKPGCSYPFKSLCAGGVTFKLVQAMCTSRGVPEKALDYLDFVAVASASDMVPLVGENRTMVYFGLQRLNETPRPGFKGMFECSNIEVGTICSSTIVYNLAPRLNAAGRLGDARKAVELLLTENDIQAFRLAQELESKNHQRRVIDEKIFHEASAIADDLINKQNYRSLVLHDPNWHVGVINIVASRLVEKFHKPTIMLTTVDNVTKGSARSIKNFDIHQALHRCSHLLKQFGGHKYAAGLSLDASNVPELRDLFDEVARTTITDDMLIPEQQIDTELNLNELSPAFVELLQRFSPFGYQNFKPTFVSHNVHMVRRAKIVGKNHVKFRVRQGNFLIDAIGFNLGDRLSMLNSGKPISIIYTIEESMHRNSKHLQLYVKDLRPTDLIDIPAQSNGRKSA